MSLHFADYLIILVYFIFVIGVGFLIKKKIKSSNDFLTSSRSIPLWITSLAFISANLGAQEVIGMVASGAKYGIMTVHFYWVGAIFAMVFLGVFMMPFYYGSRARSVPEYLSLRFGFTRDYRDIKAYPLRGNFLDLSAAKLGLGILSDLDLWEASITFNQYFQLSRKWFISSQNKAKFSAVTPFSSLRLS